MEPWQSWAVVLTSGAILYWYYTNHNDKAKARISRVPQPGQDFASKQSRRREDAKTSSKISSPLPTDVTSSDGGSAVERNKKRKASKKEKARVESTPITVTPITDTVDDVLESDKEWARRLDGAKKGTTLAPPERKDARQRTVKQGSANTTADFSTTSSTTGAEADDDMSPAMSPAFGAAQPSGRGDVSDMLEAPAPGPSVMRLTQPDNLPQPNKAQKQSAPPVQESKKQRQNRRKVEEKKAQREEDEKQRRVLMEKQLRAAREARGEPAKNGVVPVNAAPTSNAWTVAGNKQTTTPQPAPVHNQAPLLDTFDQDSNTSGSNAPQSGASATTTGTNYGELPSEEEQTRWAMEDAGWSTVPTIRRGKKKTAGQDGTENSDAGVSQSERQEAEKPQPAAAISKTPVFNSDVKLSGPSLFGQANHPNDSDWAVL